MAAECAIPPVNEVSGSGGCVSERPVRSIGATAVVAPRARALPRSSGTIEHMYYRVKGSPRALAWLCAGRKGRPRNAVDNSARSGGIGGGLSWRQRAVKAAGRQKESPPVPEVIVNELLSNLLPYLGASLVGSVSDAILASIGLECSDSALSRPRRWG
jgi:hypothetical protein